MKATSTRRRINLIAGALVLTGSALAIAGVTSTSTTSVGADPVSTSALVGVGADVTQDLYAAYSGASPAPPNANPNYYTPIHSDPNVGTGATIQSFDANQFNQPTTFAACVTTKAGGPAFNRPNSTTEGIAALEDSITSVAWTAPASNSNAACTNVLLGHNINFARAARGPKGSTSGNLTWIPFARDALAFIYYDHGTGALSAVNLTTAELTSLYTSSTGTITIPDGGGTDTLEGCLTITGSTPRSNMENLTGAVDGNNPGYPGCNQLVQNSGDAFGAYASTLPAGTDAIVPISSGSWIGQANGFGVDRSSTVRGVAGYGLASIKNAANTVLGLPYTTNGSGQEIPSTPYYQDGGSGTTGYGYNIYTVVPNQYLSGGTANSDLVSLFSGSTAVLCQTGPGSAQATANLYGFDTLTVSEGTCGSTTQHGTS